MSGLPFDTLKLARGLRDKGGFSQQQAEGFAEALAEAMPGNLLTKADPAMECSLSTKLDRVGSRLDRTRSSPSTDLDRMATKLDGMVNDLKFGFRGLHWMMIATLVLEVATFIKLFAH